MMFIRSGTLFISTKSHHHSPEPESETSYVLRREKFFDQLRNDDDMDSPLLHFFSPVGQSGLAGQLSEYDPSPPFVYIIFSAGPISSSSSSGLLGDEQEEKALKSN